MLIQNKTKVKDISYTTGPKRGEIVWKPKLWRRKSNERNQSI
jgi:hypothetical protein